MKKDSQYFSKQDLRKQYRHILASLLPDRRKEAADALLTSLYPKLEGNVLSFASKDDEIDLTEFNERLVDEGRLLLSRVEGDSLAIYRVTDYSSQLLVSKWYIDEPNPALCEEGVMYVYEPNRDDEIIGDKPIGKDDHSMDSLRYMIMGLDWKEAA